MLGLYVSVFALGIAAIDPIGIGIMPILLLQKNSYKRALSFLLGSLTSLLLMGVILAKGLGHFILHIEQTNHWFLETVKIVAAAILLVVAVAAYLKFKQAKVNVEPSDKTRTWLKLSSVHLFGLGFVLVAVQSLLDVVFLVAMVRIGQLKISNLSLVVAVTVYAIAALMIQLMVVILFWLTPIESKQRIMKSVNTLLYKYSYQVLIMISLILSILLIIFAL